MTSGLFVFGSIETETPRLCYNNSLYDETNCLLNGRIGGLKGRRIISCNRNGMMRLKPISVM
jgi:hypothetical protein